MPCTVCWGQLRRQYKDIGMCRQCAFSSVKAVEVYCPCPSCGKAVKHSWAKEGDKCIKCSSGAETPNQYRAAYNRAKYNLKKEQVGIIAVC